MSILGIHHVAISTHDADRLVAFYRDQLGMEQVFDGSWPEGTRAADARDPDGNVVELQELTPVGEHGLAVRAPLHAA